MDQILKKASKTHKERIMVSLVRINLTKYMTTDFVKGVTRSTQQVLRLKLMHVIACANAMALVSKQKISYCMHGTLPVVLQHCGS